MAGVHYGGGGGSFSLEIDDEPIGSTVELAQTADWTNYQTETVSGLSLDGGVQTLRFLIEEGGITVASMQFVRTDAEDTTAPRRLYRPTTASTTTASTSLGSR